MFNKKKKIEQIQGTILNDADKNYIKGGGIGKLDFLVDNVPA